MIAKLIKLENCKFGYKLKNKKQHQYFIRNKELPNLPKSIIKAYSESYLCMGPKTFQTLPVETQMRPSLNSFTVSCKNTSTVSNMI